MQNTYFITGATGNVGSKLVATILDKEPDARLALLVRSESAASAWARVSSVLEIVSPSVDIAGTARRIQVCCGDVTLPGLGLDGDEYEAIVRRATHIVHCAASVKFNLELSESLRINVGGTKHVLGLARAASATGRLRRFCHVSTAFIGQQRGGVVGEDAAVGPSRNANPYERSKHVAERLVLEAAGDVPVFIVRPGIVVGDSQTGAIVAFNVMYAPLRMIAAGILPVIPCRSGALLDIVPVDYVASAIHRLCRFDGAPSGTIYNLTAGVERCLSIGEIVRRAVSYFKCRSAMAEQARVRLLPHWIERVASLVKFGTDSTVGSLIEAYSPYLNSRFVFVDTNTRAALGYGLTPPHLAHYLSTLLAYSLDTKWGKGRRHWCRAA